MDLLGVASDLVTLPSTAVYMTCPLHVRLHVYKPPPWLIKLRLLGVVHYVCAQQECLS